ncbi:hypothetical protein HN903_01375 [archaeon]|jgi:hypothetical protein|nr:hypothetical protein [archaeon]MBT7128382.1 hypothetical protein [archaeon]
MAEYTVEDIATMIVAAQEKMKQYVLHEENGKKKVPMLDVFYGLTIPLAVREKVDELRFSGVEELANKIVSERW